MERFSYRPAALRGAREVRVTERGVIHGDGPERLWRDVAGIGLQAQKVQGVEFVTLRLGFSDGEEMFSWSGNSGPELVAFYDMVRVILRAVAALHPAMVVQMGPTGGVRVAGFLVALGLLAVGLFLMVVAGILTAEGDWGVAIVMGPIGLATALGGAGLSLGAWPGRAAPRVPIARVIETLTVTPSEAVSSVPEK